MSISDKNGLNKEKEIAISVSGISKTFRIPHEKINSLRGAFVNAFKKNSYEEFKALDDVSFEVKKGEFFGIIGRNGSGKSTLLKILAGIYEADKGKVKINGLISPFLELGIGFNPELSGRDNIYLNAAVLGLTKKQIDEKFDDIVKFSELERFIDQKLKNYSSGMQVRLAFSVAIHANREILLMDEVLAVGDLNFQSKCLEEFSKYKHLGKTVVLVTHDIFTVQKYCDRAMLIRNGQIKMIGYPEKVGNEYIYQNMSDEEKRILLEEKKIKIKTEIELKKRIKNEKKEKLLIESVTEKIEQKNESKKIIVKKVEFLDDKGKLRNVFQGEEDVIVKVYLEVRKKMPYYNFGLGLYNQQNVYITGIHTLLDKIDTDKFIKNGFFQVRFVAPKFKTNSYFVKIGIVGENLGHYYDFLDRSKYFKIFYNGKKP